MPWKMVTTSQNQQYSTGGLCLLKEWTGVGLKSVGGGGRRSAKNGESTSSPSCKTYLVNYYFSEFSQPLSFVYVKLRPLSFYCSSTVSINVHTQTSSYQFPRKAVAVLIPLEGSRWCHIK